MILRPLTCTSVAAATLAVFLVCATTGRASTGDGFAVASGGFASDCVYDGTDFLVVFGGDKDSVLPVGAQFVSPTGAPVGLPIMTGHTGGYPLAAGDPFNTQSLMVWNDGAAAPTTDIYGEYIGKMGASVPFPIHLSSDEQEVGGVAYCSNNGSYLVVYFRLDPATGRTRVYGRIVSSPVTVGPEFAISSGYGSQGASNVAFDGENYLVAWCDDVNDTDIWARRVGPTGALLGGELSIDVDGQQSDNPLSVCFGGTEYLVLWTDEIPGSRGWDLYGQRVSTTGALVGGVIPVSEAPGQQFLPCAAYDPVHDRFLVTWTDMRNDANQNWTCDPNEGSCWDIYGQYVDASGGLVGGEWPLVVRSEDQVGSAVIHDGGQSFFMAWNTGDLAANTSDAFCSLVHSAGFPAPYCTAKVNSLGCTPMVTFAGIPSASDPDPFDVGAVQVVNNKNGILFYGFAPNSLPFQGGYLCVQPPIKRTPVQSSGGDPPPNNCSGTFSYDFNARIQSGIDPGLVPGTSVYDQYWYRDPQSPSTTGLTDAVGFDILP